MSAISRPEGGSNNIVEIGQGNLKLHYSAQEGKLVHYSNSRNLVSLCAFNLFLAINTLYGRLTNEAL